MNVRHQQLGAADKLAVFLPLDGPHGDLAALVHVEAVGLARALHGDGTAHAKMDAGQANGLDVDKCGKIAVRAIKRQKHRKLIGRSELLMAYIHKYCLPLYYKLSRKISAT